MSSFGLFLFDFDGTLADSFPFFVSVFNRLAQQHGFKNVDEDKIEGFRGYSVQQMMQHVGLPAWKLPIVARSFMGLMKKNSSSIRLFEGITELFTELDSRGILIGIVTSNSHDNVRLILGPDNMARVTYMESSSSIFSKASRITRILNKSGVPPEEAIYIGDQPADLKAAHKAKVAFGAVAWGYPTIESLRQYRPDYEFADVADIGKLL